MTNTTTTAATTKNTSKIGASVTCRSCGLTYGDHAYHCPSDAESAKFFTLDRRFVSGKV